MSDETPDIPTADKSRAPHGSVVKYHFHATQPAVFAYLRDQWAASNRGTDGKLLPSDQRTTWDKFMTAELSDLLRTTYGEEAKGAYQEKIEAEKEAARLRKEAAAEEESRLAQLMEQTEI
jgi:hypothetical protein